MSKIRSKSEREEGWSRSRIEAYAGRYAAIGHMQNFSTSSASPLENTLTEFHRKHNGFLIISNQMKCDICSTAGSGTIVSAAQIRDAVSTHKFDPFALGLFPSELLLKIGRTPAKAYQEWLPVVENSDTDWSLCPRCFAGIKPYLEKGASRGAATRKPAYRDYELIDKLGKEHGLSPEMVEFAFGPLKEAMRQEEKEEEAKKACFIATAAYRSTDAPAVQALRDFRDHTLANHRPGRVFIGVYMRFSPPLARLIEPYRAIRWLVRTFLIAPLAWLLPMKRSDRE